VRAAVMNIIEACDKAAGIISQARGLNRLYRRGIRCLGDGRLRSGVMDLAAQAIKDEEISRDILLSEEKMVGFLCGIWVQFLLVEIAGVEKDRLHQIAQKAFAETVEDVSIH